MGDNILDDLDGLLSTKAMGDETFRNELSYYSGLKRVTVDREINDVYNRKVGAATDAVRLIKSDKRTIKITERSIKDGEDSFNRESTSLRKLVHEIREARRTWKDSSIFSKESEDAKQRFLDLKQQYAQQNKGRHKIKERIAEDKARLAEKEAEISEQEIKLKEANSYIEKLEKGIRNQFNTVNKMLATRDYIRHGNIDLNNPSLSAEAKAAIIKFSKLTKEPLKISIVQPLTDQSSELMQIFSQVTAAMQETDKIALKEEEQQRINDCKEYVKRLQEDPSLDALEGR